MFSRDQARISRALGLSLSSGHLLFPVEREAEGAELLCFGAECQSTVVAVHPRDVAVALSAWSQLLDENLSSVKATFQGYANAAASPKPPILFILTIPQRSIKHHLSFQEKPSRIF